MYVDTPERSASTHKKKRPERDLEERQRHTQRKSLEFEPKYSFSSVDAIRLLAVKMASLRNRFFVLRHGQSLGNVAKIIVSDPKNGCSDYGLSDIGKEQACQVMQTIRLMI
jgi:hypothetical protein